MLFCLPKADAGFMLQIAKNSYKYISLIPVFSNRQQIFINQLLIGGTRIYRQGGRSKSAAFRPAVAGDIPPGGRSNQPSFWPAVAGDIHQAADQISHLSAGGGRRYPPGGRLSIPG